MISVWSSKGGSGTSTVAAALALRLARTAPARLADLAGDQPAVLGVAEDPDTGLSEWMAAAPGVPRDALERLAVAVTSSLAMLPLGTRRADSATDGGRLLAETLAAAAAPTVADLGRADRPNTRAFLDASPTSVVVLRPCYLALRRAAADPLVAAANGVVLLTEPRRALGTRDVQSVLGLPVVSRVPVRPEVARAVDAGTVASRLPECLARAADEVLAFLGGAARPAAEEAR